MCHPGTLVFQKLGCPSELPQNMFTPAGDQEKHNCLRLLKRNVFDPDTSRPSFQVEKNCSPRGRTHDNRDVLSEKVLKKNKRRVGSAHGLTQKNTASQKQNAHVLDDACKGINQSGRNLDCNVNGDVQEECLDISTMPQLVEQLKTGQ